MTETRWKQALQRVRAVERRSTLFSAPFARRDFSYSNRSAWSTAQGRSVLPPAVGADQELTATIRARTGAEALLVGKFDVAEDVRLRAFYPGRNLTMRYQIGGARNGVERNVAAWDVVGSHDATLMPRVVDHGVTRKNGAWLVEEMLDGRPARRSEIPDLVEPIAARLHRIHRAVGIEDRRLSDVVHDEFHLRWQGFCRDHDVEPALAEAVTRLIERDDHVQVSFGHGDLVVTNIHLNDDGFVLTDWEFAGPRPIAFDLAKLPMACDDVAGAEDTLVRGLRRPLGGGSGSYTFPEQIALAHVQVLTWYESRQLKAQAAGRENFLKQATRRQVRALRRLLDVPA